jgi:hypothetical protein
MKRAWFITLLVVVGSLAAQAQGGWAGVSQCYIGGRWVTVKGNCPAPANGNNQPVDNSAAIAAAEAERQRQEAELQRQEEERRRQEEERQRREAEERKRKQEEFERNKAQALRDMKGISGELGLKGVDSSDSFGLKGLGENSGAGLGLKGANQVSSQPWDADITRPQIKSIARRLDAIQVPPPVPQKEASLSWKRLYLGNKSMADTADHVLDFWELTGTLGESASLGCKIILIAGKTFIAGEDGAYVHLVKQDRVYESALRYLKDPSQAKQFTRLVQAVKEKRPIPASANPEMLKAARAILDPKLGSSGTRIAWDAMLSPEARAAMVRKAALESGAALVSTGTEGLLHDLTQRKELYTAAMRERDEARKMLLHTSDVLYRDQLKKVIGHANAVLDDLYRLQRVVPVVASGAIGDAAGELAEIRAGGEDK